MKSGLNSTKSSRELIKRCRRVIKLLLVIIVLILVANLIFGVIIPRVKDNKQLYSDGNWHATIAEGFSGKHIPAGTVVLISVENNAYSESMGLDGKNKLLIKQGIVVFLDDYSLYFEGSIWIKTIGPYSDIIKEKDLIEKYHQEISPDDPSLYFLGH